LAVHFLFSQSSFIYTSVPNGQIVDWTLASSWQRSHPNLNWPPNTPGHPNTHSNLSEAVINGYVKIYSGGLNALNANPKITVNDTLYIVGNVALGAGGSMEIKPGGLLVIDGNATLSGSFDILNAGNIVLLENLNVGQGSGLDNVNGNLYVYGNTNITGGGSITGLIKDEIDLEDENQELFNFVSQQGALFVDIMNLKGKIESGLAILNWSVDVSNHIDRFDIELMNPVTNSFQTIGQLTMQQKSGLQTNFQFIHDNPNAGMLYYRLKAISLDGEEKLSNIISVKNDAYNPYTISPNPVTNHSFRLQSMNATTLEIDLLEIYNTAGARIFVAQNCSINQTIHLNGHVNPGMYIVKTTQGNEVTTQKIIIK
jgi:hypothetical protein